MRSAYLLFNVAVLSSLLGTAFVTVRFWSRWRGFLRGLLFVSGPFVLWDMYAAASGHWFFNQDYTFSARFQGLPIEEILFFISVPAACMFVWSTTARFHSGVFMPRKYLQFALLAAFVAGIGFGIACDRPYTRIVLIVGAFTCLAMAIFSRWINTFRFLLFELVTFALFLISNSVLTGLPIITYGNDAITGYRVGTIPIEDFVYNFALINMFLLFFAGPQTEDVRYHKGAYEEANPSK